MEPKNQISQLSLSFPWLSWPSHKKLLALLSQEGGEGRFIGGAVRNSLLQRDVKDFDCATTHRPEKVMEFLQQEGIKVIPTGINHGTVTAVIDHRPYEITTLRRDIETDGRRAKVIFTDSWKTDAARRDFTINALSLDADGQLFDYFEGLEDLKTRHVRFIGTPAQRIQEDYLRILRFFRFQAFYGSSSFNAVALEACIFYKSFLETLARERITQEFLKILEASHPLEVLKILEEYAFFPLILGQKTDFSLIQALLSVEEVHHFQASPLVRLTALLGKKTPVSGLRLSNQQQKVLHLLAHPPGEIFPEKIPSFFYRFPQEIVKGWIFLQLAEKGEGAMLLQALQENEKIWKRPHFPLTGEDILALGVKGKEVGNLLQWIENWWIDEKFSPNREACLTYLKSRVI